METAGIMTPWACDRRPGFDLSSQQAVGPKTRHATFGKQQWTTSPTCAGRWTSLDSLGLKVPIQQVCFMAEPSATAPGTIDIACFVPDSAATEMEWLPGTLVASIMPNLTLKDWLRLLS